MNIAVPKLLLVDDKPANLTALQAILEDLGEDFQVLTATSGNDALAMMLENDFSVVLLDVQMPGMDGFEVAELMRSNPTTQNIPIIFVTAISKEQKYVFKGYETGAVDYLFKPLDAFIVNSKVRIFINLWREHNQLEITIEELRQANAKIKRQQDELRELAIHDHLTGLYQRRWFDEMAEKDVQLAKRSHEALSLAMIDIDYFKNINDTFGHSTGDLVLIELARVLESTVRVADTPFRFGGEEFVVLMPMTGIHQALNIAERLRMQVETNVFSDPASGSNLQVTVSIGVSEISQTPDFGLQNLVDEADKQLYNAKHAGRNRVHPPIKETGN